MVTTLLIVFCALVALAALGVAGFLVLLKLGIIVRAASQPSYQDYSDYTLNQGREVRPEDEHTK